MPDLLQFTDHVVLITGGATGIGRAGALAFARQGATLSSEDDRAAVTIDLLEADGGRGLLVKADVSNAESVRDLVDETTATAWTPPGTTPGFFLLPSRSTK